MTRRPQPRGFEQSRREKFFFRILWHTKNPFSKNAGRKGPIRQGSPPKNSYLLAPRFIRSKGPKSLTIRGLRYATDFDPFSWLQGPGGLPPKYETIRFHAELWRNGKKNKGAFSMFHRPNGGGRRLAKLPRGHGGTTHGQAQFVIF